MAFTMKDKHPVKKTFGALKTMGRIFLCSRRHKSFRRYVDYFVNQKIAGYIGYLDDDNFGDQALRAVFPRLFRAYQFLPYVPQGRAMELPVELILHKNLIRKRNWFDAVMLGGGTLIDDTHLPYFQDATDQKIPCLVFGTGVRDPGFWTRFIRKDTSRNYLSTWARILQGAVYVGVRGPRSADLLQQQGLPRPKVIGDLIFSLGDPAPAKTKKSRIVGINVGTHGRLWGEQRHINEVIGKVIQYLLKDGWKVELLPLEARDVPLSFNLIENCSLKQVPVWRHYRNIQRTMNRIKTYDVMIGQRLHSYGAGAACGIPFIALEYEPKSADFLASLEMEHCGVRTDQITLEKVMGLFEMVNQQYNELSATLGDKSRYYQRLQQEEAFSVAALLSTRR